MQLRDVADRMCDGSLSPLLMNLVKAQPLSEAELEELRRFVAEQSRARKDQPGE
jgi:predicted transcriptional regulator